MDKSDESGLKGFCFVATLLLFVAVSVSETQDTLSYLFEKSRFSGDYSLYYFFQKVIMYTIIPFIVLLPLLRRSNYENFRKMQIKLLQKLSLGGNILFFGALITFWLRITDARGAFWNKYLDEWRDSGGKTSLFDWKKEEFVNYGNVFWGDVEYIIIPICIGFVFFYNSFLKIRNYN